jgi:hypothetical protein
MDQAKPAVLRTKAADQLAKRAGQVAVFVRRREKKIFVRLGMGAGVRHADHDRQPLGTGAGMRWNLMTIPTDAAAMSEERSSRRHRRKRRSRSPT